MTRPAQRAAGGRGARRRAWFGLLTALGLAERGFFIPYRYAGRVPQPGARPGYEALAAMFRGREGRFREVLSWVGDYAEALGRIGQAPPPAPRWDQDWFPRLDAAVAYTLVRKRAPQRIVEVGAGHSTRFLVQAVKDGTLDTTITAIDPAPRASLGDLSNGLLRLSRMSVQEAGDAPFQALGPGDMLLIDSSHILMPGSDVDLFLGHVLPVLPPGVHVHFHDVFLPDDYPADWAWRGYNEQLGLLALLNGGAWQVDFASHYVATRMATTISESPLAALPLGDSAYESSLWLTKAST